MDSPQVLKFLVVRGLKADAQPVDSRRTVDVKLVLKQGAGIDLYGCLLYTSCACSAVHLKGCQLNAGIRLHGLEHVVGLIAQ